MVRRNEVINEALAEEVRRAEQRKKNSDRAAAEAPETEPTAPAASKPREDLIEPDPNPKRRLLMQSASLTASGSGRHGQGKAIPDDESGRQVEDKPETDNEERAEPPGVSSTYTKRRIAVNSKPRGVTTQEAVDGYREKAMRIESVELIELGSIMELPITGQVLRWTRQSNLSVGVSLRKADGWNVKNHSHLTVARHLREKIHTSVLVVTIREDEERGMCSAALRELLRIVKDQIGEKCAVATVLSRESTIWRRASVKTWQKKRQLTYIVVTNDKLIAEQIKSDSTLSVQGNLLHRKVVNVVLNGPTVG